MPAKHVYSILTGDLFVTLFALTPLELSVFLHIIVIIITDRHLCPVDSLWPVRMFAYIDCAARYDYLHFKRHRKTFAFRIIFLHMTHRADWIRKKKLWHYTKGLACSTKIMRLMRIIYIVQGWCVYIKQNLCFLCLITRKKKRKISLNITHAIILIRFTFSQQPSRVFEYKLNLSIRRTLLSEMQMHEINSTSEYAQHMNGKV